MAPNQFLKPETAHEKAKDSNSICFTLTTHNNILSYFLELISVGKKSNALEVLYEMMKFRRARNWQKSLEEPMLLFVELCIELKKNQHFKRIIHQYRNISIQSYVERSFDFCVEYGRKTEFRKLSEMLRMHTTRIQTQPVAQNAISLTNPDTQIWHFETRLRQLDCAMQLELYNEAFKTVEDIWNLVLLAKTIDRPALMADYYNRAAELFLRSGCYLFHAAAVYKRLVLHREHKKALTPEELSALGSKALCAALSIPLPQARSLSTVPTRSSLLTDLSMGKIQSIVPPELTQLYQAFELDFQPLKLAERVKPALDRIAENPALSVYQAPLQEVLVSKTLLQLSQVYRTLHFSQLAKLCPFFEPLALERCVIELISNLELPMRVDHRRQAIIFDVYIDLGISQKDYTQAIGVPAQSQTVATDQLSRQLALYAQSLQQVTELLNLNEPVNTQRDAFVAEYRRIADQHHRELLSRRYFIEDKKEQLEKLQEERAKLIEQEEQRIAEEKRELLKQDIEQLKREELERERLKSEEEKTRLRRKIALERLTLIMRSDENGLNALKDITDEQLDQFNADSLMEKKACFNQSASTVSQLLFFILQITEVAKKRRDLLEKASARARKVDHLTRAMRLEEIPLLREAAVAEERERRELYEKAQQEAEDNSRKEHENRLKNQSRLMRMQSDVESVIQALKEQALKKYKEELAEWEKQCNQVRAERLAKKRAEEEAERARKEEAERARKEAERAQREEAERQRIEEEEAMARAEAAAKAEAERQRLEAEAAAASKKEAELRAEREREKNAGLASVSASRGGDGEPPRAAWARRTLASQGPRTETIVSGFERKPRPSAAPDRPAFVVDTSTSGWTRKQVLAPPPQNPEPKSTEKPAKQQPKQDDGMFYSLSMIY
ncbi:unnamed protein product [Schistocephalus solidus]|uniref:Eukaryotic translation initiation factor 3 subunit A n=1 Tax=Schistocephalus solidus TaxID=70667 RepID=A0A183SZN6_SCHSO|nr:unnamed protein product [Schistocephalus solidus]